MNKKQLTWRDGKSSDGIRYTYAESGNYVAIIEKLGARYYCRTEKLGSNGKHGLHRNWGSSKSLDKLKQRIEALGMFKQPSNTTLPQQAPPLTMAIITSDTAPRRLTECQNEWWHN